MADVSPQRRRVILAVVVLAVLVGIGIAVSRVWAGAESKTASQKATPERKVPVLVENAVQRDVPIVLEGLGTVTPLATVSVRSQVDGQLVSIAFQEGAVIKKGQQLAQIDPRPFQNSVAQTNATFARDQAALKNAKLMLQRNTELRAQNLIAQQQVDDQQSLVDQAEATAGISKANNDSAKLQLEYSRVVSPIDGVAGIRQVDPGNIVRSSDVNPLVVLTQIDPIAVIFTVPQDEITRIQTAAGSETLGVEVWSRDGRAKLAAGSLSVIDNQVNSGTGTLRLKALFANPTRALWPNQFVKARLTVEQKRDAMVIAAAAIQRGPKGTFVYIAAPDDTAQLRPVEVDIIEGPVAVLSAGVKAGERVITDGQSQLKPGAAIDPRTAAVPTEARGER